ncbi:MAG: nucleoside recognition domain-containing protein, partial [Arenicellales bacterium]
MNVVFLVLVSAAFVVSAVRQLTWVVPAGIDPAEAVAPMQALGNGIVDSAQSSVTLAIGLVGVMALFLGLMKVAEAGGLLTIIARALRPLLTRLFPDVPPEHPAMGAIILNLSANVLGLGNAATPFGIRAMQQLDRLNPRKGTATNAMVLFLAVNTSSVTLLPTGVIALRAAAGSHDPAGIVPTTLFATICSTTVAIVMAKLLQRYWSTPDEESETRADEFEDAADVPGNSDRDEALEEWTSEAPPGYPLWVSVLVLCGVAALVPLTVVYGRTIAPWIIPGLVVLLLVFGAARR